MGTRALARSTTLVERSDPLSPARRDCSRWNQRRAGLRVRSRRASRRCPNSSDARSPGPTASEMRSAPTRLSIETGVEVYFRDPRQPVAARIEREHQRSPSPVLPERQEPRRRHPGTSSTRSPASSTPALARHSRSRTPRARETHRTDRTSSTTPPRRSADIGSSPTNDQSALSLKDRDLRLRPGRQQRRNRLTDRRSATLSEGRRSASQRPLDHGRDPADSRPLKPPIAASGLAYGSAFASTGALARTRAGESRQPAL